MTELLHSSTKIAHKLVAKTAKEITEAAYEIMASNNDFHAKHPNMKRFVSTHWHQFVGHARAALVVIMTDPNTTQHVKDEIYEALCTEGVHKSTPMPVFAQDIVRHGLLH